MSSGLRWNFELPSHIFEKIERREIPTDDDDAAYSLAECYGLYENTSEADDPSSSKLRKMASRVASSVVGVSSFGLGFRPYHSSGIIVEHNGVKLILTSGYILGDGSKSPKVTIILCNQIEVNADIEYVDAHHNIVLLRAELDDETTSARLCNDLRTLGTSVMAVGRHYRGRLMASSGTINNRGDHLESDDLMSSTSNISEWGIGGALIESSTGTFLGMNFFSKKGYTPFMPSNILIKCVKHFVENGGVCRPWLGLRTRIQAPREIVVKEVTRGSPADMAGIHVDDLIISCNKTSISSPAQLAGVLFRLVEDKRGNLIIPEKREEALKVKLVVKSKADGSTKDKILLVRELTPPVPNRWPVLPIPNRSREANLASNSWQSGNEAQAEADMRFCVGILC